MRIPRIFYPFKEEENNSIILNITASHHLKVINIKEGQNVELFNGSGYFFNAKVTEQNKKNITLKRTSDVNFQKKQIPSQFLQILRSLVKKFMFLVIHITQI